MKRHTGERVKYVPANRPAGVTCNTRKDGGRFTECVRGGGLEPQVTPGDACRAAGPALTRRMQHVAARAGDSQQLRRNVASWAEVVIRFPTDK